MTATITYRMGYLPHPYDAKARKQGVLAWCLIKVVTPEVGPPGFEEPVAIFNFNSEAELFMGHVIAAGLDKKLVTVDGEFAELQRLIAGRRAGGSR